MSEQQFVEYRGLTPEDFLAVRAQIDAVLQKHCAPGSWRYANDYGDAVGAEGTSLKVARPDGWGGLDSLSLVDEAYCDAFSDEGTVWHKVVTDVIAIMEKQWNATHPDEVTRPFYAADKPTPVPPPAPAPEPTPVAATPTSSPISPAPQAEDAPKKAKPLRKAGEIPTYKGTDGELFVEHEGIPETYWDAIKDAVEAAIRQRYADHEWQFVPEPYDDGADAEENEIDWSPGEYRTWLEVIDTDKYGRTMCMALIMDDYCNVSYMPGTRWGDLCEDLLKIMSEEWSRRGDSYNDHGGAYTQPFFSMDEDVEDDED